MVNQKLNKIQNCRRKWKDLLKRMDSDYILNAGLNYNSRRKRDRGMYERGNGVRSRLIALDNISNDNDNYVRKIHFGF